MKPSLLKSLKSFSAVVILLATTVLLGSWNSPVLLKSGESEQDTTKKSKQKSAQYSRKSIITFDENGVPHEELSEDFEGDEGLRNLMKLKIPFEFNVPAFPNFPDIDMRGFPDDMMLPSMPPGHFQLDSLDMKKFYFDEKNFEGFGEEFEALIKDKFESFGPEFEAKMERMHEQLEKMDFEFSHQLKDLNLNLEEEMSGLHETLEHELNENLEGLSDRLNSQFESKSWEERVKEFETEAQKELVNDGYLESSEKIESISWSDDEIKFNGKTIKPEHTEKYRDLRERSMNRERHRGRPE